MHEISKGAFIVVVWCVVAVDPDFFLAKVTCTTCAVVLKSTNYVMST
jgi:hypothetical protein